MLKVLSSPVWESVQGLLPGVMFAQWIPHSQPKMGWLGLQAGITLHAAAAALGLGAWPESQSAPDMVRPAAETVGAKSLWKLNWETKGDKVEGLPSEFSAGRGSWTGLLSWLFDTLLCCSHLWPIGHLFFTKFIWETSKVLIIQHFH